MESEEQRREAEEGWEDPPTTNILVPPSSTAQASGLQTACAQPLPQEADCARASHPHGVGGTIDLVLQNLESSMEFQMPETLKKNSKPHSSIRRNIYLIKRVKTRAEDDGVFCSCNSSTESAGVCGKDCFCGILLSCCTRNCKCGPSCLNKPFQQRPIKKMKLTETEKCGLGVVANEDIKKGEFVIEYVGEVINDKMCEERLWKMKDRGEQNFYLCEINRDTVIDATYKGNKSRYINHSCQPNTEMQKWRIDGETRIGLFAIRDISKGEELCYDYKFVQFGADQDCHCGATSCRQKLGCKSSKDLRNGSLSSGSNLARKRKDSYPNCIGRVVRIWCARAKRNYGGVILEFDNFTKKHLILKEDGQLENYDLTKEEWDIF